MPLLRLAAPPPSATLATNERVQARIAAGAPVLHLGLRRGRPAGPAQRRRAPGRGGGRERLRAGRGLPGGARGGGRLLRAARAADRVPSRILLAPGSKALLYALLTVLPGDVVLPRPSWVSYAAQAALAGKRVVDVPIAERGRRRARPRGPARGARRAARPAAREPAILVLTLPDNPTGTLAPAPLVEEVCEVAARARAADRVRRDLPRPRLRPRGASSAPPTLLPERTSSPTG